MFSNNHLSISVLHHLPLRHHCLHLRCNGCKSLSVSIAVTDPYTLPEDEHVYEEQVNDNGHDQPSIILIPWLPNEHEQSLRKTSI